MQVVRSVPKAAQQRAVGCDADGVNHLLFVMVRIGHKMRSAPRLTMSRRALATPYPSGRLPV